jgi:hypothetical protein
VLRPLARIGERWSGNSGDRPRENAALFEIRILT